jgi:multicomponent Na+:H+ antiporter subunit D
VTAVAPLAFLVPILCGGAVALSSPLTRRWTAILGGVVGTAAAATLAAVLLAHVHGGTVVVWLGGWRPERGVAFGIDLAVDRLGAGLALFSALLAVVSMLLSARLILVASHLYHAVALLFVAAMIGFCLTGDLFNLFVFFELMSVSAYALVGYEVRRRAPLEGSLTFAVTNSVGSILMLFGIGVLYGATGALNLAQIGRALAGAGESRTVVVAFGLIAVGLLVKAAAVPFHFWVADAYAVAPTPVCILLAGVYSELGLYGLARVWWTAFDPALGGHAAALRAILVGLGLVTGLAAGALALAQHHLRRMLAFVTIAQIGVMLVGVGLLDAAGLGATAVFLVGDGLVKAALFTCVAVLQHRYDAIDVRALHARARELPGLAAVFGLAALAVAGLPPFGPFRGRALLEDAALGAPGYRWVPALLALISALSAAPLLRAGLRVFGGWGTRAPNDPYAETRSDDEDAEDEAPSGTRVTSPWLWGPAVLLLAASLGWGVWPGVARSAAAAAARFTDPGAYAHAVLGGGSAAVAVAPPVQAPGLTAFLYAAASTGAALALAAAGLRERPNRGALAAGLDRVRALHSGHPGDYVTWVAVGATVLIGLFALALT